MSFGLVMKDSFVTFRFRESRSLKEFNSPMGFHLHLDIPSGLTLASKMSSICRMKQYGDTFFHDKSQNRALRPKGRSNKLLLFMTVLQENAACLFFNAPTLPANRHGSRCFD